MNLGCQGYQPKVERKNVGGFKIMFLICIHFVSFSPFPIILPSSVHLLYLVHLSNARRTGTYRTLCEGTMSSALHTLYPLILKPQWQKNSYFILQTEKLSSERLANLHRVVDHVGGWPRIWTYICLTPQPLLFLLQHPAFQGEDGIPGNCQTLRVESRLEQLLVPGNFMINCFLKIL